MDHKNTSSVKELYNDYWSKLLKIFNLKSVGDIPFDKLWNIINIYELTGEVRLVTTPSNGEYFFHGLAPNFSSNSFDDYKRKKLSIVLNRIPHDTTTVIDFGSGWGRYSTMIASKFPHLNVFSMEYSDFGVEVCSRIKDRFKLANLHSHKFDYNNPDEIVETIFSKLKENEKIFCFSSYSVEQVPILKDEFYNTILNMSPCPSSLQFLHIEPIGWQITPSSQCLAVGKYNRNLWKLALKFENLNRIRILETLPDHFGKPSMPASLIRWEKV